MQSRASTGNHNVSCLQCRPVNYMSTSDSRCRPGPSQCRPVVHNVGHLPTTPTSYLQCRPVTHMSTSRLQCRPVTHMSTSRLQCRPVIHMSTSRLHCRPAFPACSFAFSHKCLCPPGRNSSRGSVLIASQQLSRARALPPCLTYKFCTSVAALRAGFSPLPLLP